MKKMIIRNGEENQFKTNRKGKLITSKQHKGQKIKDEELKSRFLEIYADIPTALRREIIAVIDNEPMSWNVCMIEIKNSTKLGERVLEYLRKLEII